MVTDTSIAVIATSAILSIFSVIAVIFRLIARHVKAQQLGIDDYLIVIATVSAIRMAASCSY